MTRSLLLVCCFLCLALMFKTKEKIKDVPVLVTTPVPKDSLALNQVSFADLTHWHNDDFLQALPAIKNSCPALTKQNILWKHFCVDLNKTPFKSNNNLREFLEKKLIPYTINSAQKGLFTGYFQPIIKGSRTKTKSYQTPLYALPDDIIKINLGRFNPKLKGEIVYGKVTNKTLEPYLTRAEIETSETSAQILAFVNSVDAFMLQIQGSGVIDLGKEEYMSVGYAGNNGHKFVGIGSIMEQKGLLKKGVYTMSEISDWLKKNPKQATSLMHQNPRFIFFKNQEKIDAIGALGVPLTPQRSLAVDPAYINLGSLLWLEISDPDGKPLNRLMTAQDTGSAIKGVVRGDFFWGAGEKALYQAGRMRSTGSYFILMPKEYKP